MAVLGAWQFCVWGGVFTDAERRENTGRRRFDRREVDPNQLLGLVMVCHVEYSAGGGAIRQDRVAAEVLKRRR